MALSAEQRYEQRDRGRNAYIVKTSEVIYPGALVGVDPNSGYLQAWDSDSAAIRFLGLAEPRLVPTTLGVTPSSVTGNTAATEPPETDVNESGVILESIAVTSAAQTSVGAPVYASDDNTFTVSATSNVGAIGRLVRFVSASDCDVELFTPAEYMGVDDAGQV